MNITILLRKYEKKFGQNENSSPGPSQYSKGQREKTLANNRSHVTSPNILEILIRMAEGLPLVNFKVT